MSAEKFKLPSSSYEELTKIIKAYGHFPAPAELGEVSKLIGMDSTVISRNVGFLLELAILEPGKKKTVTSVGRYLAQALEHEMPDEIRKNWREIVSETEFLNKLITSIKIRNGMDEGTLQSHIAFSAGQPKKPAVMTGARTVMDILRASELIREQDGKIILAKIDDEIEPDKFKNTEFDSPKPTSHLGFVTTSPQVSNVVTEQSNSGNPQIKININVTVDCSTADLDTLGEKINRIIKDVNREIREDEETDIDE
ncbi:MAG TPA: hypothetical protein DCE77_10850 [Methylophaga sp.]|jgi:hypothetical protein|uniref:hypothetical protein n=1 Tax=unclassified Methylophaga TaxID=2629249 RepID=UPI000C8F8198|nr:MULTISPECIES: hypothetical protein [unclassified Methylophaga]MAP25527.1 hypothetical protein [Methylophaga sp.]HAD32064.1 hypothetical protein [Methylophaga sp.]HCO01322.1 hypothetical protein [Methylophaga sp.]|tara:strand:- start:5992 stop:6753 length:762 start_codon:yes stop_codon:yes gene_type:complete